MRGVKRPAHKTAHQPCPYGALNWVDCDAAAAHQWGHCKVMVGDREPSPCTRWAFDAGGYCGQHYVSMKDTELKKAREAQRQLQLQQRIDEYIRWAASHPSVWDSRRGMAAGEGLEPSTSRVTTDRSTTELPRKGPHKLRPEDL